MPFRKITEGRVTSDNGVSIQIKSYDYLEYSDNGKALDISLGFDPASRTTHIYVSDLKNWNATDQPLTINEADLKQIKNNLEEAFRLLTGKFLIC